MSTTTGPRAVGVVEIPTFDEPVVSIVMVTYGTGEVLLDALAAVVAHTDVPYEVIVVDNPPDDGRPRTSEWFADRVRGAHLLVSDRNLGFAGGNEVGVEHASGEYLCFLNPDAIVPAGWLGPLVAALDDPAVAVAAPVFRDPDLTLQEAGGLILDDACTMAIGGPELLAGDESQVFSRDVDYASAACWVVRRSVHDAIGGFDPAYHPAYFEDADYAMRVARAGCRVRLVADVEVIHHRGGGGAGRSAELGNAARERFLARWHDELRRHAARPTTDAEGRAARDHWVTDTTRVVIDATERAETRASLVDGAIELARQRPRERVVAVVSSLGELTAEERLAARSAGLEVVVAGRDDRSASPTAEADAPTDATPPDRSRRRVGRTLAIALGVAVVAAAGIALRVLLLRSTLGALNADEAYFGLETLDILDGDTPVVIGGTVYTAVIESYLFAPFAAIFGLHVVPLKVLHLAIWALAVVLLYVAGRDLGGRKVGVAAAAMAWVTPGPLITVSANAYAGYQSGMATTLAAFVVARRLLDDDAPSWKRPALLGVLAGLAFWMHPIHLAVLVPVLAVVVVRHRRRLATWVAIVVGGLVGCAPFLVWNAANGWPSFLDRPDGDGTYLERLWSHVSDLAPRSFGLLDGTLRWHVDVVGPVVYALLLGAALAGVVIHVRRDARPSRWLLPVVLVAVAPLLALMPPTLFAFDGRYGVVFFPYVVLAVALAVGALLDGLPSRSSRAVGVVAVASVWSAVLVAPQVDLMWQQRVDDPNQAVSAATRRLEDLGVEHVRGSYWRVHPIDFLSDGEITGAVLSPFPVRLPERQLAAESAPDDRVAFVFQTSDDDPSRLAMPVDQYVREVYGDTVVYLPTGLVAGS